ncbi:MAG TPA: VWA domain-containing protein [Vicinamibacterales bacterium]|nr:VWA domain-containing protein [Vicinamibacterales bacterium]
MTMRTCGLFAAVAVAMAAGASSVIGQEPAPPPATQGPTFRSGVDLITVDVGVVDGRGNPVEDLGAAEFSVKVDGEVRRVVSAELVKVDVEAAKKTVADKNETFYTSNLTPPNGRQIVIAVDQMHIRPGSIRPIMAAAQRFLDKLSPLDQVAFIVFPEPGPRVNFTSDKLRLRLAMQGLIGQQQRAVVGQHNIGVSEALAITNRRDQLVLAQVAIRECRSSDPMQRAQCERDIVTEAGEIARRLREETDESVAGFAKILRQLTTVEGHKSLILLSEGLALDDQNELRRLVSLAGAARTSINVMALDLQRGDVTVGESPPTETQDRRLQMQGLEGLATMSMGSLFYVAGTGEPIFERLSSEISAYYLLGVEQRPKDREGDRHRIDVDVRRRGVTIRSRQAFVLSPTANAPKSANDSLRDALLSPFAVSGLPLRVTTFAHHDTASDKVRLMVSAQVGQPGAPKGEFTVGYLLVSDDNRIVGNYLEKRTLEPAGTGGNEPLDFLGGVVVEPGIYTLRFGVIDTEGRRGSVLRDVNAWKMAGETLALGDLIVGPMPEGGKGLRAGVEPHITGEALAAHMELYSTSAATFDKAEVTFDVVEDPDAPALSGITARLTEGAKPTWRTAAGFVPVRALPPGRYVARARITREGKAVGVLTRPFVVDRAAAPTAVSYAERAAAAKAFAATLPKFDREAMLARDLLAPMLDAVEKRSPTLKDAMVEARAGRYGAAALEALGAGDQTAASFLRGVDFYAKGQLDQAATQLAIAAGPRREFFPAAFFLGASYASAGRDRDAAGVWQMSMGSEPRPPAFYGMVADARLRDGIPDAAIDILKPAYAAQPANDDIARRLGMAYVMTTRYAEAMPVLDALLTRHPSDQTLLLAAIVSQYELVMGGQLASVADVAKMRRYVAAYKGPESPLARKYLESIQAK